DFRRGGRATLIRPCKCCVINANRIEESARPGGGFDRFKNDSVPFAPETHTLRFDAELRWQSHGLNSIDARNLGGWHGWRPQLGRARSSRESYHWGFANIPFAHDAAFVADCGRLRMETCSQSIT